MLDDDFLGIGDRREIDRLVPLNDLRKVAHELFSLVLPDGQSYIHRGTNHEFVQFPPMFHVEQLRESANEVKTFRSGDLKSQRLHVYDETCTKLSRLDSPLYFSSATRRREIAAGVTPEILEA